MKLQTFIYAIGAGILLILKAGYAKADTQALWPLLLPVQYVVSAITGAFSVYAPSGGYYFPAFNILIDKSCSGGNFFIICVTLTVFTLGPNWAKLPFKPILPFAAVAICYVCTLMANISRVMILLWLGAGGFFTEALSGGVMHRAIGILVYVPFLLALYWLMTYTLKTIAQP